MSRRAKKNPRKKISAREKASIVKRNLAKARAARWAGHKKAKRSKRKHTLSTKEKLARSLNLKKARAARWKGHKKRWLGAKRNKKADT